MIYWYGCNNELIKKQIKYDTYVHDTLDNFLVIIVP